MYSAGMIFWLPAKRDIPSHHRHAVETIDDGCFNHPVLVLSVNATETEVTVLIMTSFGGRDLEDRYPGSTRDRSLYAPIYPSRAHPDNGMLLFLVGDQRPSQSQTSYVILNPCRIIKTALLRTPTRRCQLSPQSLKELIEHIRFQSPWPTAVQVREAFLNPRPGHSPLSELASRRKNSARSYTPNYERPFAWDASQHQSTYLYPYYQQATLPQTVHVPGRSDIHEDETTGWKILRRLLVLVIVVFIILDETKSF